MAGRWKSAQRRKRWTDTAARPPDGALESLTAWPALEPFARHLEALGGQASTYGQLGVVKNLGKALLAALQLAGEEVRVAIGIYVELLFVENSRPLHRGLLSSLSHFPVAHVLSLRDAFQKCSRDYGWGGVKYRSFSVVAVAASMVSLPQPGPVKEIFNSCIPSMIGTLCKDVRIVLEHAANGGRPTPTAVEECQDALSSIYYMIQQFPNQFSNDYVQQPEDGRNSSLGQLQLDSQEIQKSFLNNDGSGRLTDGAQAEETNENRVYHSASKDDEFVCQVYGVAVCTLLDVLKKAVLSRDCMVAAGVGLAAAAQLCASEEGLALILARAVFPSDLSSFSCLSAQEGLLNGNGNQQGILGPTIATLRSSSLGAEIKNLSDFGKLCFFRGIVTAIPRRVQTLYLLCTTPILESSRVLGDSASDELVDEVPKHEAWALLYDGILPALCKFCESSVDSHFKFHAITAMQICLQQIKTSICGQVTISAYREFKKAAAWHGFRIDPYDPLPAGRISQILQLIWNNWEDPLTQTVKQCHVVFDLLVDVRLVHQRGIYANEASHIEGTGEPNSYPNTDVGASREEGVENFLRQISEDLLTVGRYRKGKYVPLASLVLRVGARNMLEMSPDLLFHTVSAFSDDDVCSSASTFLKAFLDRLKEDCWSAEGVKEGTIASRRSWVPALLSGLLAGDPRLRNNLTIYALPVALGSDSDSLSLLLAYILHPKNGDGYKDAAGASLDCLELQGARRLPGYLTIEQQVVLLVSVVKVARSLALVEGSIELVSSLSSELSHKQGRNTRADNECGLKESFLETCYAVLHVKSFAIEFPVRLLLLALTHREDGLRVDTVELMCLNPKTASMPSALELSLLKIALPLNMRCASTAFRMRWISFLRKFFVRVRTAVDKLQKDYQKICSRSVLDGDEEHDSLSTVGAAEMQDFMQWLTQMLVSSLYPSAPYQRKNMAMEVFSAILEVWSVTEFWETKFASNISTSGRALSFFPYHESLLSEGFTLVLVGAMVDSWDRLREGAYKILTSYPTPLPGISSERSIEGLLQWAKSLVNSPRVRESDAGALLFRLVFRKYVLEMSWHVTVHPEPRVRKSESEYVVSSAGDVVVEFLGSLLDWLEWGVEEGTKSLVKACTHSFVHGVLLVLRYTFNDMDWTSSSLQGSLESLRKTLERLLSLLLRVTSLALWVVSADALKLSDSSQSSGSTVAEGDASVSNVVSAISESPGGGYDSDDDDYLAPAEQMVMVGCWLSVKEVSLLFGTIARTVPLPGSPALTKADSATDSAVHLRPHPDRRECSVTMLDGKQLEAIGNHFVQVLLSMKHNGAIDKTRTGFIALCDRLLRSNDPWLNKLPEIWLQHVMNHTAAKGQVVDNLLRRSAGLPPAFLALFLAEPDGLPKKLLPVGVKWLIDTCKRFLDESKSRTPQASSELDQGNAMTAQKMSGLTMNGSSADNTLPQELNGDATGAKNRDEGVVPTVHAFNVLRMTFHDTNLATDTSGFCSEGLITAIRAFASSHWEVRNSATLAFTALVHRTIGFLNVYKRESARRAITGFEFFHRYPDLHPFLLQELKSATWQLEQTAHQGAVQGGGLSSLLHPSLGPVLIILSRLKPSHIKSDVEDWLNPSAFIPYVTKCATQRNLHVRVLASKALAPLVPAEDLLRVMLHLAKSLPEDASKDGPDFVAAKQNRLQLELSKSMTSAKMTGTEMISFNSTHGILLQMDALLKSSCMGLPDVNLRNQIVAGVAQALKERLWLGSIRRCRCYWVIGSFLDVLDGLLNLAKLSDETLSHQQRCVVQHLKAVLSDLCQESLDAAAHEKARFHDSTRTGLREKAAKFYFQIAFANNSLNTIDQNTSNFSEHKKMGMELEPHIFEEGTGASSPEMPVNGEPIQSRSGEALDFSNRLRLALVDRSYEVRLATLKVLKKHLALQSLEGQPCFDGCIRPPVQRWTDLRSLRPLVIERLRVEEHPRCIHRMLQVIYAWTLIDKRQDRDPITINDRQMRAAVNLISVWDSGASALDLWWFIFRVYDTSKQIKTREVALRCLGGCLQQMRFEITSVVSSGDGGHSTSSARCVQAEAQGTLKFNQVLKAWLETVQFHSAASEPVTSRRAAAESIIASGILEDAECTHVRIKEQLQEISFPQELTSNQTSSNLAWYTDIVLAVWCSCIKLLEDEDLDLRQNLALSILKVIKGSDSKAGATNSVSCYVVPSQVEDVIHTSFAFLSKQFGFYPKYYDVLAEWVLGEEDASHSTCSDGDLIRPLFDKEIDNHHEEELFFVQLCCLQIESLRNRYWDNASTREGKTDLSSSLPSDGNSHHLSSDEHLVLVNLRWYDEFCHTWRRKFLDRIKLYIFSILKMREGVHWVGGLINHQDTFRSLYRCILGLIFLGPKQDRSFYQSKALSHRERDFVLELGEVGGQLRELPLNPLVTNALIEVLEIYEQWSQVKLESLELRDKHEATLCSKFSLLFLIR